MNRGDGVSGYQLGSLHDWTVLVTGAGRGIGRGTCEALTEAGAAVVASDLDESSARDTAGLLHEKGGKALGIALDVTDQASVEEGVVQTVATFGRLDGLVANAGVVAIAAALDTTDRDWQRLFDVNARGLFVCCRVAARQMEVEGTGGAIVNVASNAGKVGYPNMAAYNATKAAVINLTRNLAGEWASRRINVNAVCPGGVATPMLEDVAHWVARQTSQDPVQLHAQMVPRQLARHILPIEVGRVIAFLLSADARIIRGQAINVDGGDTPY